MSHAPIPQLRVASIAAAIACCLCGAAPAATIAVNDSSEGSVTGKCTLVDAVFALNNAVARNGCSAGDGNADTIDLAFFTTPTTILFTLATSPDLNSAIELRKPATIRGPLDAQGHALVTLARSALSGVSFRLVAAQADLALSGVNVAGGSVPARGAGVYAKSLANLTLTHSSVSGNTATSTSGGGISVDCGNVSLIDSSVSGNTATHNGGGIYLSDNDSATASACSGTNTTVSTATLLRSSVSGNHAGAHGGGVFSFEGVIALNYSTIDSNVAASGNYAISEQTGGGVYAGTDLQALGSTISHNSAAYLSGGLQAYSATLRNSTIVANDGGRDQGAGNVTNLQMQFCTVTGNTTDTVGSGGLGFNAHANIVASIISGNTYANLVGASFVTGSNNIIGAGPREPSVPFDTRDCDVKLGPLAANGGATLTIGLGSGSCAIDTGPASPPGTLASDQRGRAFARKVGVATDVGAFEVQNGDRVFYGGFEL